MNAAEALKLCRLVKALCPSQAIDEYTPEAWAVILANTPFADAQQAVKDLASLPLDPGKARYIEPGHIIGGVRRIQAKRLEANPLPTPPAGLSPSDYLAWERSMREQIAAGVVPERNELTAQPLAVRELVREAAPQTPTTKAPAADIGDEHNREVAIADLDAERERQLAELNERIRAETEEEA